MIFTGLDIGQFQKSFRLLPCAILAVSHRDGSRCDRRISGKIEKLRISLNRLEDALRFLRKLRPRNGGTGLFGTAAAQKQYTGKYHAKKPVSRFHPAHSFLSYVTFSITDCRRNNHYKTETKLYRLWKNCIISFSQITL